jgi:hypothetical protein
MSRNFPLPSRRGVLVAPAAVDVVSLPATLIRFTIGLLVSILIVVGLTNPSGAQTSGNGTPAEHSATLFTRCLHDWDAATHMSRQEWSAACHRLLLQRGEY